MKRLRSFGEGLGSASGDKEIERSLSAAGSLSSSSSSHQRRWRICDNIRSQPGVPDDDRDREMSRGGVRKRIDHDFNGFDHREGSRGLRRRSDHDFGNDSDDREPWRSVRKRIDHDLDGFDDREGGRGPMKRIDHDFPDNFDNREGSRGVRKRFEHDIDGFDRRKGSDRYRVRDSVHRGGFVSPLVSPRGGYVSGDRERDRYRDRDRNRIHRSESFCVSRGDFPKGFRSERDWSKREGSIPSWPKFGSRSKREVDEDSNSKAFAGDRAGNCSRSGGLDGGTSSSRESFRSPHRSKDVKSPTWSRDSKDSVEPLKDVKKSESTVADTGRSGGAFEIEEGELQPDSLKGSHSPLVSGKEVKHAAEIQNPTRIEAEIEESMEKKPNESESVHNIKSSMLDSADHVRLVNKEKVGIANEPDTDEKEQFIQLEVAEAKFLHVPEKLSSIESTFVNRACQSEERTNADAANDGDEPAVISESLRDDHPECSVPANDELGYQAEEVNDPRVSGPIDEGRVGDSRDLEICDNNGDKPAISESLRDESDDHPESSVPANNEVVSQATEDVNDTVVKCSIVEEKVEAAIDLEVDAEDVIAPQLSRDVIVPQVTKDVDVMPQVTEVVDVISHVTEDVDVMAQVVKDVDIMPPVIKNIDIMPPVIKNIDIMPQVTEEDVQGHHHHERQLNLRIEKDKGKGVGICSDEVEFAARGSLIEQSFISFRDIPSEGPSIRGFELFSCVAGLKAEKGDKTNLTKSENEKMNLEPLELSLSLPNVSVPAPHSIAPPQSSPPRARSVQSRATTLLSGSDAFTTSISFSGSQFMHNPSCSLTHNSVDYDCEQSVKSRPLFQGVDWQALSMNDTLPKELLNYQKGSGNMDGSLRLSNSSQAILNSQSARGHDTVLDRSVSLQRHLSGIKMRNNNDVGSVTPAQSAGSQGTMLDRLKENRQSSGEVSGSRIFRSTSHRHMKQAASATHESDFINNIAGLVASEPVQTMAWKLSEMADESIRCLKEGIQEILLKEDHKQQLFSLQVMLNNRSDLTLETLLKCHRVQLEILVAIRTGVPYFLWRGESISLVNLAEIFLNLKCRNPNCGSALPADECDCKFCSNKSGFCNMCMCLVCSEFDTASNTCGWVGCDFCSHWCHTDCGLQKSFMRNGQSVTSAQGTSEMQFYCMSCDHPSEMFGFVSDVFKTCSAEWEADNMLKELEYVKRIFAASNDPRGKLLHGIASQLLVRLKAGSTLQEIYNQIMGFFKECESRVGNACASSSSGPELQAVLANKGSNRSGEMMTSTENPNWLKSIIPSRDPSRADNVVPSTEGSSAGNRRSIWDSNEIPRVGKKKPVGDELEGLVKIKLAEANMFQSHADNARREAERLKQIASSKSEKIDEEYTAGIAKLKVGQVEETRRRKVEELQNLERSHQEYMNMKRRMQDDIKELLLRMEDAKKKPVHG